MANSHEFKKSKLRKILKKAKNKTLGQVDSKHVFNRTIDKPKITGIAGDVIEQSVLGYPPDHDQRPDLLVDGILYELKTTGIREGKRSREMEAKEPVTITAVSIDSIAKENFEESYFWHKAEHILFVFYHYDSTSTVKAAEYAKFYIRQFDFYDFSDDTKAILESDWKKVHDFIADIQNKYNDEEAKKYYSKLSSEINKQLVYLDTAPKYPNPPRFRFRRRFVTKLYQEKFGTKLESLPDTYHAYSEVYEKCHDLTTKYSGWTFKDLCKEFEIDIEGKTTRQLKSYAERIVVEMFRRKENELSEKGKANKLSKIDLFVNFGLIGKTIAITSSGKRTEDMKLISVNFNEIEQKLFYECTNEENNERTTEDIYEDESSLYSYLHDHKLLCIIFEEQPHGSKETADLRTNKFKGFKVLDLDSQDIMESAENSWNSVNTLLNTNGLQSNIVYTKEGKPRINKNGLVMEKTNLPKSRKSLVFLRGTGRDSSDKYDYKGVKIYRHNFWIKGSYIAEQLEKTEYL